MVLRIKRDTKFRTCYGCGRATRPGEPLARMIRPAAGRAPRKIWLWGRECLFQIKDPTLRARAERLLG